MPKCIKDAQRYRTCWHCDVDLLTVYFSACGTLVHQSWCISCLGLTTLGHLDLSPLDLRKAMQVTPAMDNLCTKFELSMLFHSCFISPDGTQRETATNWPHDIDFASECFKCSLLLPSFKLMPPVQKLCLSILWPATALTSTLVREFNMTMATFTSILDSLELFVLHLWSGTEQTHGMQCILQPSRWRTA